MICIIAVLAITLVACHREPVIETENFAIASFNLEAYGATKASNTEIISVMAQIIRNYDIVAVQEIRDSSMTQINILLDEVNAGASSYMLTTSDRLGRTSSKEQYGIFYNTATIAFSDEIYTYDDDGDTDGVNDPDDSSGGDTFEREPFGARFSIPSRDLDFVVVDVHIRLDDAVSEIGLLSDVMNEMSSHFDEPDVVCVGTFNADGSYYDEANLATDFPDSMYIRVIDDAVDTTVAGLNFTYDRIIARSSLSEPSPADNGVYRFDTEIDFGTLAIVPSDVSDRFPVFAELVVETDLD